MRRTILRGTVVLLILALLAPFFVLGTQNAAAKKGPFVALWLTILHNNDGESKLLNAGAGRETYGGVASFKTLVDELKWEATHGPFPKGRQPAKRAVLMLSSGDNFLAGPEFNASIANGVPFYDTIAMDLIGYDAVAIGNHDFDFGPDVLADFIEGYESTLPPYLSSNLVYAGEPRLQSLYEEGRIARSTMVRFLGQKVGIIGATTPALPFISSPRNVEVLEDVAGAIQEEVYYLESKGVRNIILISHLQSIQEDLALAPMLDGVDIMIAGGGDELLANEGDLLIPGDTAYGPYPLFAYDMDGTQVPVVTTSGNYAYLGRLVAGFDKLGNLVMLGDESGPIRVANGDQPDAVPADPEMVARVVEPVTQALADLAANVIGVSQVDLDGRRAPGVRTMETNEGNLIADSLLWQATELAASFGVSAPDVALQNGGGIRNDTIIPAGNVTELTTFSMVPFANFLSVVENIPRAQFKEILENAYSRVEFGDGRFAQIAGFRVVWDPAGTAQLVDAAGNVTTPGNRVVSVVLDDGTVIVENRAVVAGDDLTVATIDFLARGGDQYPFRGAAFTTMGATYQQALRNYIVDGLSGVISEAEYPEGGEGRIATFVAP
jgi:2',3'-cyclic-nucleotide 2'-phosphodiesterase (5'-nucleotidase family)